MKIKFTPLGRRILIKHEYKNKTDSGALHLPETASQKAIGSRVIDVGNEIKATSPIQKGVQVSVKPYAGQEIELNGEHYFLVDPEDILGIVELIPEEPKLSIVTPEK